AAPPPSRNHVALSGRNWWTLPGSNRRPHACKARALPSELRALLLPLLRLPDADDDSFVLVVQLPQRVARLRHDALETPAPARARCPERAGHDELMVVHKLVDKPGLEPGIARCERAVI